ncbi:hypothetical protein PM082_007021 [Marasmius tenuissimus]|nr:hypothetical protein PM082_007021 [Marasmius tenuissimus]
MPLDKLDSSILALMPTVTPSLIDASLPGRNAGILMHSTPYTFEWGCFWVLKYLATAVSRHGSISPRLSPTGHDLGIHRLTLIPPSFSCLVVKSRLLSTLLILWVCEMFFNGTGFALASWSEPKGGVVIVRPWMDVFFVSLVERDRPDYDRFEA